jgi:hypothetical protein
MYQGSGLPVTVAGVVPEVRLVRSCHRRMCVPRAALRDAWPSFTDGLPRPSEVGPSAFLERDGTRSWRRTPRPTAWTSVNSQSTRPPFQTTVSRLQPTVKALLKRDFLSRPTRIAHAGHSASTCRRRYACRRRVGPQLPVGVQRRGRRGVPEGSLDGDHAAAGGDEPGGEKCRWSGSRSPVRSAADVALRLWWPTVFWCGGAPVGVRKSQRSGPVLVVLLRCQAALCDEFGAA